MFDPEPNQANHLYSNYNAETAQNTFSFQKGQAGKEKYESQVSPKSNWENNNVLSLFLFDVGFHTAQGGHELSM